MIKTIRATVSSRILEQAEILFDNTPRTIFAELLQNSRRAGASQVAISVIAEAGKVVSAVTIHDNGRGVDHPEDLLTLGGTGWSEDTQAKEAPAGMGFFSLCASAVGAVQVRSGNFSVLLNKKSFRGEEEVKVEDSPCIEGTEISFVMRQDKADLVRVIEELVRYYPAEVLLNGVRQESGSDFLRSCVFVKELPGYRIGLQQDPFDSSAVVYSSAYRGEINFHGLVISQLPLILEGYDAPPAVFRIDIKDTRSLNLVPPARDKVVQNGLWDEVKKNCHLALFEFINEKRGGKHDMSFAYYQMAASMGCPVPESELHVEEVYPRMVQDCGAVPEWNGRWQLTEEQLASFTLVDSSELECIDLALLGMSGFDPVSKQLAFVSVRQSHAAYSWMPKWKVKEVYQVAHLHDGKDLVLRSSDTENNFNLSQSGRWPDSAEVVLVLEKDGNQEQKIFRMPAKAVVDSVDFWNSGAEDGWVPVMNKLDDKVTAMELRAIFFSTPEDVHGFNAEQAEVEYLRDARLLLLEVYDGDEAAANARLSRVLDMDDLRMALRDLNVKSLTIDVTQEKWPKVTLREVVRHERPLDEVLAEQDAAEEAALAEEEDG